MHLLLQLLLLWVLLLLLLLLLLLVVVVVVLLWVACQCRKGLVVVRGGGVRPVLRGLGAVELVVDAAHTVLVDGEPLVQQGHRLVCVRVCVCVCVCMYVCVCECECV